MAQTTSPAETVYGSDNVYSNVPLERLEQLWEHVEAADQDPESGFSLQPGFNYLTVDLNRFHLRDMLEKVTADALREYTKGGLSEEFTGQEELGVRYPHHTSDTVLYFFHPKRPEGDPDIEFVFGRVKQRDSLTEKITRELAENGRVFSEYLYQRNHLPVDDCYAATFVCRDEELAYAVQQVLTDSPFLTNVSSRDFIANPKNTGYRALHDKFIFIDGIPDANGLVVETHIETRDDHRKNKYGNGENGRDHHTYSMRKLRSSRHEQGNNQILIFEKNGHDHDLIIPVNIGNRYAQYTLFNY